MSDDRVRSEQPTHNHFAYRYAACGAELRTLKPTPGLPDCQECAQIMAEMEAREVSERLADAGTTQSAPEPSQAATEAHSDEERVARYVEAANAATERHQFFASHGPGRLSHYGCTGCDLRFADRHGHPLHVAYERTRAVMAVADAERARAWDEGFASGKSRAMRYMSDEPSLGLHVANPYRAALDGDA